MGPNGIGIGTRVSPPTQRRGAAPTTTAAGGGANRPTSASEFIQSTVSFNFVSFRLYKLLSLAYASIFASHGWRRSCT